MYLLVRSLSGEQLCLARLPSDDDDPPESVQHPAVTPRQRQRWVALEALSARRSEGLLRLQPTSRLRLFGGNTLQLEECVGSTVGLVLATAEWTLVPHELIVRVGVDVEMLQQARLVYLTLTQVRTNLATNLIAGVVDWIVEVRLDLTVLWNLPRRRGFTARCLLLVLLLLGCNRFHGRAA